MRRTERGATAVEYALLVALMAVACITAVSWVQTNASRMFGYQVAKLSQPSFTQVQMTTTTTRATHRR
jgi:Flp pilus assembly pilin Flp